MYKSPQDICISEVGVLTIFLWPFQPATSLGNFINSGLTDLELIVCKPIQLGRVQQELWLLLILDKLVCIYSFLVLKKISNSACLYLMVSHTHISLTIAWIQDIFVWFNNSYTSMKWFLYIHISSDWYSARKWNRACYLSFWNLSYHNIAELVLETTLVYYQITLCDHFIMHRCHFIYFEFLSETTW